MPVPLLPLLLLLPLLALLLPLPPPLRATAAATATTTAATAIATAASASIPPAAACTIRPPYRAHRLVALTVSTARLRARVVRALRAHCELRFLDHGRGARIVPRRAAHLIVTPPQFRALRRVVAGAAPPAAARLVVLSRDLGADIAAAPRQVRSYTRRRGPRRAAAAEPPLDRPFYTRFRAWPVLADKWARLAQDHAPRVAREVIGRSLEGRDIVVLRIGSTDPANPRRVLLNGLQHAREWVATHVPTYVVEALAVAAAADPPLDPDLARILTVVQLVVIPLINPDGYVYSDAVFRLQRKNRRRTACHHADEQGVDLNRNWAKNFSGGDAPGTHPCDQTYYGSAPFSEPESRAVRDFILATDGIRAHVDFHSFGQLVLKPWSFTDDHTTDPPPRDQDNCRMATAVAEALTRRHGLPYHLERGTFFYTVGGTMSDWVASQGIPSVTVELRPAIGSNSGASGFLLSEEQILPTCQEGLEAVETLLRFVEDPQPFQNSCPRVDDKPTLPDMDPDEPADDRSALDIPFIVGISVGAFIFVLLLAMIIVVTAKARRRRSTPRGDPEVAANGAQPDS